VAKVKQSVVALEAPKRDTRFSPKPIILAGMAILVLFFGGIALWGMLAPLHAAAHAQGEVVFRGKRQTVQHLEGGIVKEILVKDGDQVKAGQPLIILEDEQVKPIVDMLDAQVAAEVATLARLEAEKNDATSVSFPGNIPANIIQTEQKLFNARLEAFLKQLEVLKSQIEQTKEMIKGSKEQLRTKGQEIDSLKEQLEANQTLLKDGYVTKTMVLELERHLAEKTGEREQINANIAANQQRLAEYEQRILAIKAERIQQAANEIKVTSLKRLELEERVRPSRNTLERLTIRAPIDGQVVGLKVATIGGIIVPREPVMEIASMADHLIIEAKAMVSDISELKLGQEAEIHITAFKSKTIPTITARVTYISADRLTSHTAQGEMPYYLVHLDPEPEALKLVGEPILPGMQAQVTIATRARTAFDYLIGPLTDRLGKAYHAQ